MKFIVDKCQIDAMMKILDSFEDKSSTTFLRDINKDLSQIRARLIFISESNEIYKED